MNAKKKMKKSCIYNIIVQYIYKFFSYFLYIFVYNKYTIYRFNNKKEKEKNRG